MKKIIAFLLLVCILLPVSGCFGPIPFSEELKARKKCYIDVVEISPLGNYDEDSISYFECKLQDNSYVLMKIENDKYVEYIDNEAGKWDIVHTAYPIIYDEPVRFVGRVHNVTDKTKKGEHTLNATKVFFFEQASPSALEKGEKDETYVEFTSDTKANERAYVDLVDIEVQYIMYSMLSPEGAMCLCTTVTGDRVWMYVSVGDYNEYFDASTYFKYDVVDSTNAKLIKFSEPVRVNGITANKEDMFKDVNNDKISGVIFEFMEADKEQIETVKQ